MREPENWDEKDILKLIAQQAEESLTLDFKAAGSLQEADGRKTEIAKDVSAFANSAGGTIVYGVNEFEEEPHYAKGLSAIDPRINSKEWLEQVINSRVQPRIPGIYINPIELKTSLPGKFVYVVVIPESYTAHQASDKRYYKRFNFQSVAMEDYEVRQVMSRASRPAYQFQLQRADVSTINNFTQFRFTGTLQNMSEIVGHDVSATLFVPRDLLRQPDDYVIDVAGLPYTRIAGRHTWSPPTTIKPAVDSAHPLVPYYMDFPKTIGFSAGRHPAERFTAYVRVFDRFGLALVSSFHVSFHSCDISPITEVVAAKRTPAEFLFPLGNHS